MKQTDLAIMTIVIGAGTESIWEKSRPYFEAYADKVNADLIVMRNIPMVTRPFYDAEYSTRVVRTEEVPLYPSAHWLKLTLNHWLNKRYRRLIYMDADIIIRPDCPNLFDIVPENDLGIFNEGKFVPRGIALHDARLKMGPLPGWDGLAYYNTGVMVMSRYHRHVFNNPEGPIQPLRYPFGEQTYLNHRIISRQVPIHELTYQFNRMGILNKWTGVTRLDSYIVHYAGMNNPEETCKAIEKDGERWRADAPEYKYEPCIFIEVMGGLGDQVNAEPSLRYLSEKIHPKAEIIVLSTWPELFGHLSNVKAYNKTPDLHRDAIFEIKTHPDKETALRRYVSHFFTHGVDYASLAILKRTLPHSEKQIKLEVKEEDRVSMAGCDADILIHPGRGWPINTFPLEWWNQVISLLSRYYKIAIIGKNINEEHGVLSVDCPANGIDFRDKLSLGQLLAMIEKTWCLLTNDSSPVHLAGAFNNNIILIPTSKHPDHLLPFRRGRQDYKAKAIYRRLLEEDYPMTVNMIEWSTRKPEIDVKKYLPEPDDVAKAVMKFGIPGKVYSKIEPVWSKPRDYTAEGRQLSPPI